MYNIHVYMHMYIYMYICACLATNRLIAIYRMGVADCEVGQKQEGDQ